ncbi:MAG: transglycosylase domain-containing protein, partial [Bdellovibrionales bacterium]|nr:transglycosylase domain-containing protein [Bdellovibrionales bacterium]
MKRMHAKLICWFSSQHRVPRALFAIALVVLVSFIGLQLIPTPSLQWPIADSKVLFDRDGNLLTLSLTADEKYRFWLPLEDISPDLIESTLQYEDRYFYRHPGVNPYSILRAAWTTLFAFGTRTVGGSTLTMQLVRLRLRLNTRSVVGKLKQIFWALFFELRYSKHDILEAYLNLAPYGSNVEGIGAASLVYFRHPAGKLTAREAVSLAVLPQHPSLRWRPEGKENLDRARERLISIYKRNLAKDII